jgi:hypothetical protein
MEAYQAVYAPQELTEEQVWEEVENWVNNLIEEGYDLSDCTWEEMYESYIEEQGRPANRRTGGPSVAEVKAKIDAKDAAKAAKAAQRGPTGAAARPDLQIKSTKVVPSKGGALAVIPKGGALATTSKSSSALAKSSSALARTPQSGNLANRSSSSVTNASIKPVNVRDITQPKGKLPSGAKPPALPPGTSTAGKALRVAGKLVCPAAAALEVADEKSKGSGWARSLAKGAAVAAGGALGGAAGSVAGPVGTVAGATGGSMAASKAFDVAAGKNAVQRAADREANRKRQAGGALKGIGGPTSFDTKKGTMTTGSGSQKKTVQLAKTGVVKNPETGKAETGFLAYKGGKAIYKRAAKPGEGSSSALERIGRTFNPDAYKANDAKLAAQKLKQASQSDIKRQQDLGVKGSKNLVGPKILGPKIVGAKPAPPKPPAGGGMGGKRGGR